MARPKSIPIRETLSRMFSHGYLRGLAHETGAVVRERKVDVGDLFWTLVLGFALGKERSIAGLRRSFEKTSGLTLAPSRYTVPQTP